MTVREQEAGGATERLAGTVQAIREQARATNLRRAEQVAAALEEARAGGLGAERREQAAELAHQIVGSAGTFGFASASELAGRLEDYLRDPGDPDQRRLTEAQRDVATMRQRLQGEPDAG